MKLVVVYNPKSGSALAAGELKKQILAAGHSIEKLIALDDDVRKKLQPFIKSGATVAVTGGDGTISAVAGCLAGTKAVLVPLAGGTLNHFVKDLGAELGVDRALETLAQAEVRTVDVAKVNDRVFINNSSIGLYPSSLRVRSRVESKLGKWPAAVVAAFVTVARLKIYTVTLGGKTIKTPFIFVGNNMYSLGAAVERKDLNKGVLSVFVAKTVSRWVLLKIALGALVGRAHELNEFDVYKTSSLTITAKKRTLSVARDGELERLASPLHYKIEAGALRVRFTKIDGILRT